MTSNITVVKCFPKVVHPSNHQKGSPGIGSHKKENPPWCASPGVVPDERRGGRCSIRK